MINDGSGGMKDDGGGGMKDDGGGGMKDDGGGGMKDDGAGWYILCTLSGIDTGTFSSASVPVFCDDKKL